MKVLVADDNQFYRLALKGVLLEWGYEVVEAIDGRQAFKILSGPDAPKLALIDWIMPNLSGPDLCRQVRSLPQPEAPYLIILTNMDGQENIVSALQAGADDFIHKPFDRKQLQARLQVGTRIVKLQTSQAVVFALARAVEAKSPYTKGHSDRVTHYALALARNIGLAAADLDILRRGALLHDIGKISISDTILDKLGALTPEEYEIIKQHPLLGVEILKPLQTMDDVIALVRSHHERCDGKGYPDGLTRQQIPFLVRILSVADVYDALASKRPYRPALKHQDCLTIMQKDCESGGLDPDLTAQFLGLPVEVFGPAAEGEKVSHFHSLCDSMPLRQLLKEIA